MSREMGIGGLIRGAPGPCIGIVGADVFRAAVLELPPPRGGASSGAGAGGTVRLALADPAAFADEPRTAPHWQARAPDDAQSPCAFRSCSVVGAPVPGVVPAAEEVWGRRLPRHWGNGMPSYGTPSSRSKSALKRRSWYKQPLAASAPLARPSAADGKIC